ncbi:CapA family protein [Treponema sp. J25]|uniref:CapA family protein n=1 Tax=Treponema sp. J25 TaxID=2094121 RepID=UPI00104536AC|nr:CapA family protein [Treponema sp. J25]TCW62213.1 hypothetical protein C5O22_02395 [Treponema sp. J25]
MEKKGGNVWQALGIPAVRQETRLPCMWGVLVFCLWSALLACRFAGPSKTGEPLLKSEGIPLVESSLDFRLPLPQEVRIGAVGDIMLDRLIGTVISRDGWASPFMGIKPLFEQVDIGFANLESPASFLGKPYPGKDPEITFRANPGALLGLKYAGIDVVSLANNHANDHGKEALLETIQALEVLGIAVCGAGENYQRAHQPAILRCGPYRIAFLAYAEPVWSVTKAGEMAGVATIEKEEILADIKAAKQEADLILVSLHWGVEHQHFPLEKDRALAHDLIDAGAHGILGHHPHVLQGIEIYRGYPILYSLGNCIFDMRADATYETVFATLNFDIQKQGSVDKTIGAEKDQKADEREPSRKTFSEQGQPTQEPGRSRASLRSLTLIPLVIEKPLYRPGLAGGERQKKIQEVLKKASAPLGTTLRLTPEGYLYTEYRP